MRPIHVILRTFIVVFGITDVWPDTVLRTALKAIGYIHDDWLANSGMFANHIDYPTNVDLYETNHIPPVLHDGNTVYNRVNDPDVTVSGYSAKIQHRIGHAVYYTETGYAQQHAHRRYWGVREPHIVTPEDTVPLASQSNTLTNYRGTWAAATSYAVGDCVLRSLINPGQYHPFRFRVNCTVAHTSSTTNAPYTGVDWRLYWSNTNPPEKSPATEKDHCFVPDIDESFEGPGALSPGWTTFTSGAGVLNLDNHFNQSQWLEIYCEVGKLCQAYAQFVTLSYVDKLPYVVEFDIHPMDYNVPGIAVVLCGLSVVIVLD